MNERVSPGSQEEQLYSSMVPMGRFGQPSEIAAAISLCGQRFAIAFFYSEDAAFIMEQTLIVDGGARVVLQKVVEDRKLPGKGINYATTPKIWLMKRTRSLTALFSTPLICPFRIMLMIS